MELRKVEGLQRARIRESPVRVEPNARATTPSQASLTSTKAHFSACGSHWIHRARAAHEPHTDEGLHWASGKLPSWVIAERQRSFASKTRAHYPRRHISQHSACPEATLDRTACTSSSRLRVHQRPTNSACGRLHAHAQPEHSTSRKQQSAANRPHLATRSRQSLDQRPHHRPNLPGRSNKS